MANKKVNLEEEILELYRAYELELRIRKRDLSRILESSGECGSCNIDYDKDLDETILNSGIFKKNQGAAVECLPFIENYYLRKQFLDVIIKKAKEEDTKYAYCRAIYAAESIRETNTAEKLKEELKEKSPNSRLLSFFDNFIPAHSAYYAVRNGTTKLKYNLSPMRIVGKIRNYLLKRKIKSVKGKMYSILQPKYRETTDKASFVSITDALYRQLEGCIVQVQQNIKNSKKLGEELRRSQEELEKRARSYENN